jgi:DNA polymerase-1
MPRLYVFDSFAQTFRSYYAFINSPLLNSKGEQTSVIYGYISALLRLIYEQDARHLVIAMDLPGPGFRHEVYPEYKANRAEMPEEMKQQMPHLEEFQRLCGLKVVSHVGMEADDVMATLAVRAQALGWEAWLVTKDKDMTQLLGNGVAMMQMEKSGKPPTVMGPAEVREKWGVEPGQMRDLLALMGDASDNVPGVPKVGAKTAATLLGKYGSLEGIYANLTDISAKGLRTNLEQYREQALLSQRLVTLRTDLDLGPALELESLDVDGFDVDAVAEFCREHELNSLLRMVERVEKKLAAVRGEGTRSRAATGRTPEKQSSVSVSASGPDVLNEGVGSENPAAENAAGKNSASDNSAQGSDAPRSADQPRAADEPSYLLVTEANLPELLAELAAATMVAVDTETTSLESRHAGLVGLCLATGPERGWYVPVGHRVARESVGLAATSVVAESAAEGSAPGATAGQGDLGLLLLGEAVPTPEAVVEVKRVEWVLAPDNLSAERVLREVGGALRRPGLRWVMHHAKYDLQVLENAGYIKEGWLPDFDDSMLASWCLDAGDRVHSLDEQVERRLNHKMIPIEALIGKGKEQIGFERTPVAQAAEYGAEDAVWTWRLWAELGPELEKQGLLENYRTQEVPLVDLLRRMEARGICIDSAALQKFGASLAEQIKQREDMVYREAGQVFNIASPKQLGEVLFGDMGLAKGKKTKTGAYSTNAAVLEDLRWENPIVDLVLNYRELVKLKNTYVDVLPDLVDRTTGRVHTSFNQCVAATGRLSSNNPNLQNIPIRTELGKEVRSAFVARDSDHVLLSADYSQIELRVMAHLSEDAELCAAYKEGADIHTRTASILFHTFPEMVTREQRQSAKAINFGVIYGMSAFRLAREQGIPMGHAQQFIDDYFLHFAGVRRWIDATIDSARRQGSVDTVFGHRRHIPELFADNRNLIAQGERMAVNSVIQGTAADLMKRAMIRVDRALAGAGLRAGLLLQVHDELVLEVHRDDAEALGVLVKREMEAAAEFRVPLVAELGSGRTWLAAH